MAVVIQRSAFFESIQKHDPSSISVIDSNKAVSYTYGLLLQDTARAKEHLLQISARDDHSIAGERVAFLIENGYDYVVTLLAIIACNAIAVPLAPSVPAKELRHILTDCGALVLLSSSRYSAQAEEVMQSELNDAVVHGNVVMREHGVVCGCEVQLTNTADATVGGMMLFTSGTTARPKGVKLSIATLEAQAKSLIEAWKYAPSDHLLHVLPLHHIHGTVNALLTPLLAGSSIEFMYPFNVTKVWERLGAPFLRSNYENQAAVLDRAKSPITLLTAVPTIWSRMLQAYSTLEPSIQQAGREAILRKHLRLNISGSAALPQPIRDGWIELSRGNVLLERYGMTEVGMALSCGLEDIDRVENSVGWPLPGVEARLWEMNETDSTSGVIEHGEEIDAKTGKHRQGEIQLRGGTVFKEYWQNPTATAKEFTHDGWFKTGDIAIRRVVPGAGEGKSGSWAKGPAYFIQGRQSADIIKTGGEKVSALEVERELLSLPQVEECAVVGLPSQAWGQKVAAVVVISHDWQQSGQPWTVLDMRRALKSRLVGYKIPQDLEIVAAIKRNAMGKVNKKELVPATFGDTEKIRRRSFDARQRLQALNGTAK